MRKLFLLPAVTLLFLQSCATLYNSLTPHVPAFSGGNQFVATGALGSKGADAAFSYAPVNHFYAGANATGIYMSQYRFHAAAAGHAGMFFPIGNKVLDIQGGYGFGNARWVNQGGRDDQIDDAAGDFTLGFGQIALQVSRKEHSAFGFGARYTAITYHYTRVYSIAGGYQNYDYWLAKPAHYGESSVFFYYDEVHNENRRVRLTFGLNITPKILSSCPETASLGICFYVGGKKNLTSGN
ncbi:MAG TPA: hypothetical protein VL651_13325 [Bacteroidia bacterium]|jgi:hypothetical protein|nr:hypothetical protein [Bacteroidia bacterium]